MIRAIALVLALALILLTAPLLWAEQRSQNRVLPGPVRARVIQVIDGDTLIVRARIWLGQEVQTKVRLTGIDTPELRGKCAHERDLAQAARAFVVHQVADGEVSLRDIHYGKYAGRVLARVATPTGTDLTAALITKKMGRPYSGGRRAGWCG